VEVNGGLWKFTSGKNHQRLRDIGRVKLNRSSEPPLTWMTGDRSTQISDIENVEIVFTDGVGDLVSAQ